MARNGRAMQGPTAAVTATTSAMRTDTGSAGGPTAMAASHNEREAVPVASRTVISATMVPARARIWSRNRSSLLITIVTRSRKTAQALISQSPARQSTAKNPGTDVAKSANRSQNSDGGLADLTTPSRPITHRTRRNTSVGRRERGLPRGVVNSFARDGRDHSGPWVARWLITGYLHLRWRGYRLEQMPFDEVLLLSGDRAPPRPGWNVGPG